MKRRLPRSAAALLACAALALPATLVRAQPAPKLRPAERPADRPAKPPAPAAPVIGCPSLANYRMLMQGGPAAAAATLADPKADHLGCASLPRARIGAVVDKVSLGGHSYDCAAVKDTTVCHWVETGTLPGAGEEGWR
ncbi:hypothetical protein [Methylobacterium aerolatum]|uniref:Secreted protein n=1 Tax=Methylobacterium aerolatum TaxID=418708 RepID=A0ABU0HZS3_9HYPH|nr:hypothetical protein [Methylobacterium aerolatum]MDQ0447845.1 hypothetical protein [Methylobacterium aerolatum]GJD34446.1 hypothetical protein FMGBMHLM_1345 [Methylobacterium aerolatum]